MKQEFFSTETDDRSGSGERNSWYCVVDEAGQIQLEQRVRTTAKALQEVFGTMPRSRIALEIGTHSPWISRLLSAMGHEVMVANARKVRLIRESRKKDDRLDVPGDLDLAIFRLECLTNVHRHSGSKTALIQIAREGESVRTEVQDDGKGISPERLSEIQAHGSGVGIRGIRERIRQFHGEMKIESNGSGTSVIVSIPMPKEARSA